MPIFHEIQNDFVKQQPIYSIEMYIQQIQINIANKYYLKYHWIKLDFEFQLNYCFEICQREI